MRAADVRAGPRLPRAPREMRGRRVPRGTVPDDVRRERVRGGRVLRSDCRVPALGRLDGRRGRVHGGGAVPRRGGVRFGGDPLLDGVADLPGLERGGRDSVSAGGLGVRHPRAVRRDERHVPRRQTHGRRDTVLDGVLRRARRVRRVRRRHAVRARRPVRRGPHRVHGRRGDVCFDRAGDGRHGLQTGGGLLRRPRDSATACARHARPTCWRSQGPRADPLRVRATSRRCARARAPPALRTRYGLLVSSAKRPEALVSQRWSAAGSAPTAPWTCRGALRCATTATRARVTTAACRAHASARRSRARGATCAAGARASRKAPADAVKSSTRASRAHRLRRAARHRAGARARGAIRARRLRPRSR